MAQRTPASAIPAQSNLLPNKRSRCRRAADILNEGKKVAMLVGAGCLSATDEVIAVAEKLNAGIAKSLLGKAAVPDDATLMSPAPSASSARNRRGT